MQRPAEAWAGESGGAHHFCDLGDVLSVFPAGEHVGECQGLQPSMDKVRLGGWPFEILSCWGAEGTCQWTK